MNRTGIIPLLLLILITSNPPVLIAEVVTQSFNGNRSTVLPEVLLTRRMNTIALKTISRISRRQAPKKHSYIGYAGTGS